MNNKIKTISAAVLAAAICASFAGCSKKDDNGVYVDKNGNISINENKFENHVNSVFGGNGGETESVSKPEPKPLDPFEGVEVTFEGIAPNVKAALKGKNSNVKYTLSKEDELKNGDKVTVTAELNTAQKDNYTLTSSSKEFTVSNRPYYIMQLSDLSDEDIQTLSKKITDLLPDEAVKYGGAGSTVNNVDFLGNINLTKNNGNYRLYFVYKENVTFAKTSETKDYIFAAYFGHIYKEKDGTLTFEDGKPSYNSSGDMSLTIGVHYVGGSYKSLDSLNSQLSGSGVERESNVKEPSSN